MFATRMTTQQIIELIICFGEHEKTIPMTKCERTATQEEKEYLELNLASAMFTKLGRGRLMGKINMK